MLTFFRKIRKGLLGSGQARKYLLYAIGEIALVVIGILIALQINNWNEWRKDRQDEQEVLREIHETLEMNVQLIENHIANINRYTRSSDIILRAILENIDYTDTLDWHFHKAQVTGHRFFLSLAGYEALKKK